MIKSMLRRMFLLVSVSMPLAILIASDDSFGHPTIGWKGLSVATATYWINDEPVGLGVEGYKRVLSYIRELAPNTWLIFKPYMPDYFKLSEKYARTDCLPFADDMDEATAFYELLAEKKLMTKVSPVQTVGGRQAHKR